MTPQQRYYRRNKERAAALRRVEWLGNIKQDSGCVDCGYDAHPYVLQFDHVRNEKEFTISACVKLSKARLIAEVAKCEVVCANCHAIRTHNRRTYNVQDS